MVEIEGKREVKTKGRGKIKETEKEGETEWSSIGPFFSLRCQGLPSYVIVEPTHDRRS